MIKATFAAEGFRRDTDAEFDEDDDTASDNSGTPYCTTIERLIPTGRNGVRETTEGQLALHNHIMQIEAAEREGPTGGRNSEVMVGVMRDLVKESEETALEVVEKLGSILHGMARDTATGIGETNNRVSVVEEDMATVKADRSDVRDSLKKLVKHLMK